MIKFVHTADLHLGSVFEKASFGNAAAKIRRDEMFKTFEHIVELAISLKKDFILICGDLFEEKYCTTFDIHRVFDVLKQVKNIQVIIAAGNHDLLSNTYRQYIGKYPNVHIFSSDKIEKKEFAEHNTVVYGLSWDKSAYFSEPDFSNVELDQSKINILMLHADTVTNSTYMPININKISALGFDYIALGHIHQAQQVAPRAYYPGCPEALDFKELGAHGIYCISLDKTAFSTEFVKTANREFVVHHVELTPDMGYIDIIREITADISHDSMTKDMHRFEITGMLDASINMVEIMDQVRQTFFYLEYKDNTVPDFDIQKLKEENRDNIIGRFITKMEAFDLQDETNKKALFKGISVLLDDRSS